MFRAKKDIMFLTEFFQGAAHYGPAALSHHFNYAAEYLEQRSRRSVLLRQLINEHRAGILDQLDACQRIAEAVHGNKTRRDGKSVIGSHIKSVVDAPNRYVDLTYTPEQEMLAWVHDVPEDSHGAWKIRFFEKLGFSKEFCKGLDGLTHRKGEKYFDYIERLSKTIALEVKIGDNRHNWADNPKPYRAELYRIASHYLLAVRYGKVSPGSSVAEWAASEGLYKQELFSEHSSHAIIENYTVPSHKSHMASIPAPAAV